MSNSERTFIMIKPDGVQRGLIGDIVKRFERKGFKLVAMKFVTASKDHVCKHYADLSLKYYFPRLVSYVASGPVLAMVWEGFNVIKTGRVILGVTDPEDSAPGTIRGDLCVKVTRTVCHGSDTLESAEKEINLWFTPNELISWSPGMTF